MMAEAARENILKVLSGNQYGAEVTLSDGTYSFGSGADADIQIVDVALQPLHGQVRLRDGKIELRATQGELSTASGLAVAKGDDSWHEIAQLDAVSAGLSKFVIAGQGADWASLARSGADRPSIRADTARNPKRSGSLPGRAIYAVVTVVAVLAGAAYLGQSGGSAAPQPGKELEDAAFAALRKSVGSMPFATDVTVIRRADGSLAIEGYVEQQVERRAIQNALDSSGLPATMRVLVRENLRADVAGTIESMALPATFRLDDQGNLTLEGTVLDPAAAGKLVENIQTGVFGLASVTDNIRTADDIVTELGNITADAGLGDLVIFRLDDLVVEATGIVPRDKMDNWVGVMTVYSRRFAAEIPLRSFVTLDQPATVTTAPIIIGTGPAAAAETGRVVAPEALAEPNEVDAQSLFAGQPTTTTEGTAAPAGSLSARIEAALTRLRDLRPDLHDRLRADVAAGRVPDNALLQEVLNALGGSLRTVGLNAAGAPQVAVDIPGIGQIGTLDEMAVALQTAFTPAQPPSLSSPIRPVAAAPLVQQPPVQAAPELVLAAAEEQTTPAPAPAEPPAVEPQALQTTQTADATAPAEQATTTAAQPLADAQPAPPLPQPPVTATATPPAEATLTVTPEPSAPATTQNAATTLPLFALPKTGAVAFSALKETTDALVKKEDEISGDVSPISPNLRALVAMQHEQLQMGRTLMRLPKPLSALPYPVDEPVQCWTGSKVTPELLPTALLLLDVLSVSSEDDISSVSPEMRDMIMETALSPNRVQDCLKRTGTAYGQMLGNSSTFLFETQRNPGFVEFLFRDVPKSELVVAGANLTEDRYVELVDGRKLREGAAPDITTRIAAIGDLGLLVRTAEGTRVQLFGNALGWRVVDACATVDCGVN
jgi:type III secretion system YscD/HrpQ family protein